MTVWKVTWTGDGRGDEAKRLPTLIGPTGALRDGRPQVHTRIELTSAAARRTHASIPGSVLTRVSQ